MTGARLTTAGLMGLVGVSALGLAALTHPTQFWVSASFSLAYAFNFAAVVAAIASADRGRKVAAGYAVCGWGYLVLAMVGSPDHLITTPIIAWFFTRGVSDPYLFDRIAHALFTIVAGLAGAVFASWIAARTDLARPTTSPTGHS